MIECMLEVCWLTGLVGWVTAITMPKGTDLMADPTTHLAAELIRVEVIDLHRPEKSRHTRTCVCLSRQRKKCSNSTASNNSF
jgi:hypothetical protein